MDVTLGEVLHVGELQVQFGEPHLHVLPGALKLLPLAGEVLRDKEEGITLSALFTGHTWNGTVEIKALSYQK